MSWCGRRGPDSFIIPVLIQAQTYNTCTNQAYFSLEKKKTYVILKTEKAREAAYPQSLFNCFSTAVIIAGNGGYFRVPLKIA